MTKHARGPFDVARTGQSSIDAGDGATMGRVRFEKRFHGDLDATSVVEMLSVGTSVPSSAAYVALEHVIGTLHGRAGSFALQHTGVMTRGEPSLIVSVVPDSGTGELAGLVGGMTIDITDGKHSYSFEYGLAMAE